MHYLGGLPRLLPCPYNVAAAACLFVSSGSPFTTTAWHLYTIDPSFPLFTTTLPPPTRPFTPAVCPLCRRHSPPFITALAPPARLALLIHCHSPVPCIAASAAAPLIRNFSNRIRRER